MPTKKQMGCRDCKPNNGDEKPKFQMGQIIRPMIDDRSYLPHAAGRVTIVDDGKFWVDWSGPDAYMPDGPYDLLTGAYVYHLCPQSE